MFTKYDVIQGASNWAKNNVPGKG